MRTGDETWPLAPAHDQSRRARDGHHHRRHGDSRSRRRQGRKFVVSGGSKRGWTTWTTAAVDPRVVAIVPASIDLLNLEKSFEHHFKVYGFWAPAVKDYVAGRRDGLDRHARVSQAARDRRALQLSRPPHHAQVHDPGAPATSSSCPIPRASTSTT